MAITIIASVLTKALQIFRWNQVDWNLNSIHPVVPVVILVSSVAYTALSFLDKPNSTFSWSFWVHVTLGILGILYAIIMLIGVIITYGPQLLQHL